MKNPLSFLKKKKVIAEKVELTSLQKLDEIDLKVVEFSQQLDQNVSKEIQMIHISGTAENAKLKVGNCISIVGSAEVLSEILSGAGMKDPTFGKVILKAAFEIQERVKKDSSFREKMDDNVCNCKDCVAEREEEEKSLGGTRDLGINKIDLSNIKDSDIEDIIKKMFGDDK
jgi:uncharacterized membrane-anchored protein YjiN (DUF445 family)